MIDGGIFKFMVVWVFVCGGWLWFGFFCCLVCLTLQFLSDGSEESQGCSPQAGSPVSDFQRHLCIAVTSGE